MNAEIQQQFVGEINGAFVEHPDIFRTVEYLLWAIEDIKRCTITDSEFTKMMVAIIYDYWLDAESPDLAEVERATLETITEEPTLKEFVLSYYFPHQSLSPRFTNECADGEWDHVLEF